MSSPNITLRALEQAQVEEASPGSVLRFEPIGAFQAKAPEYIIEGLLERDSTGAVVGESGCGKSFIASDLGLCVASGVPFAGRSIRSAGPVLYCAGEGRGGLIRRAYAWAKAHEIDLDGIPFLIASRGAGLVDDEQVAQLFEAVRGAFRLYGAPALLVVDTWARSLMGGDENSAADAGRAIGALDALRAAYPGLSVLLVHHVGKADKTSARGSSAFKAALDAEFLVQRDASGTITLSATKTKDGPAPEDLYFELEDVELAHDEHGRAIRSAWARPVERRPDVKPASGKNQSLGLDALHSLYDEHRDRLTAAGMTDSGALVSLADWRSACLFRGLNRSRFSEVKLALLAAGQIRIEGQYVRLLNDPANDRNGVPKGTPVRSFTSGRTDSGDSGAFGRSFTNEKEDL